MFRSTEVETGFKPVSTINWSIYIDVVFQKIKMLENFKGHFYKIIK